MVPETIVLLSLCIWVGLCVGSFLTVVADRVPAGRSIIAPRSACPRCGRQLLARDMVPVLSWLLLRARCRWCRAPISALYPAVELLTGAAWGYCYLLFGLSGRFAVTGALFSVLIAAMAAEVQHQRVPRRLLSGGAVLVVGAVLLTGVTEPVSAAVGAGLCGGTLALAVRVWRGARWPDYLTLGALLGAATGWQLGLLAVLAALVLRGAVALAPGLAREWYEAIPLSSFLAMGTAVALAWGAA